MLARSETARDVHPVTLSTGAQVSVRLGGTESSGALRQVDVKVFGRPRFRSGVVEAQDSVDLENIIPRLQRVQGARYHERLLNIVGRRVHVHGQQLPHFAAQVKSAGGVLGSLVLDDGFVTVGGFGI